MFTIYNIVLVILSSFFAGTMPQLSTSATFQSLISCRQFDILANAQNLRVIHRPLVRYIHKTSTNEADLDLSSFDKPTLTRNYLVEVLIPVAICAKKITGLGTRINIDIRQTGIKIMSTYYVHTVLIK